MGTQTAITIDPLALARSLIRCPSVTPADAGALGVLEGALTPLGFACRRLRFAEGGRPAVDNLFARIGTAAPVFCFAGHTDVVPPGDPSAWRHDPFGGVVEDGVLHGRGAADMKGAIAAFAAAAGRFLARRGPGFGGSIALLITGDEEGEAVNGTVRVLERLEAEGVRLDMCVVGEPTNVDAVGDMMKIGRRGSLTGRLTVRGVQGHTAYPHLADNPLPRLVGMLAAITAEPLDAGSAHFDASTLALSSIDVGNPAANVIPAEGRAVFNIRFNDHHTGAGLEAWLRRCFAEVGGDWRLDVAVSGESFLTPEGPLTALAAGAIERTTGLKPAMSTTGGTSDARFIRRHCPVVEFGLISRTIHKVDEQVPVAAIQTLARVYEAMLDDALPGGAPAR